MSKKFNQYMTPARVARLVASELGDCQTVIDFAVGEGALLGAAKAAHKRVEIIGFDIDPAMVSAAKTALISANVRRANGLTARLPLSQLVGRVGVVANPPFAGTTADRSGWLHKAFIGLTGRQGQDRAEIQFLARSLVTARASGGRVVIVLPIGFADGDIYRQLRTHLMTQYRLIRCIEICGDVFEDTEAKTVVLVIDTAGSPNSTVEICEMPIGADVPEVVCQVSVTPGVRLDAKYHKAINVLKMSNAPRLEDLKVTVKRGIVSRKEAQALNINALHTTDLGRVQGGRLIATTAKTSTDSRHTVARRGDILFPRTGSRVTWAPVYIESGTAAITDHVFRIRAPRAIRQVVLDSFYHPAFNSWLQGVSKGVCATVLTKSELMRMPVFASPSQVARKVSVTS